MSISERICYLPSSFALPVPSFSTCWLVAGDDVKWTGMADGWRDLREYIISMSNCLLPLQAGTESPSRRLRAVYLISKVEEEEEQGCSSPISFFIPNMCTLCRECIVYDRDPHWEAGMTLYLSFYMDKERT